jgi:hypothetical protein
VGDTLPGPVGGYCQAFRQTANERTFLEDFELP